MLQTLGGKQKYQVTKNKLACVLVQRINEFKYRHQMTQRVLTGLHNTLHYVRLSR